jgi:hypothetical protein
MTHEDYYYLVALHYCSINTEYYCSKLLFLDVDYPDMVSGYSDSQSKLNLVTGIGGYLVKKNLVS